MTHAESDRRLKSSGLQRHDDFVMVTSKVEFEDDGSRTDKKARRPRRRSRGAVIGLYVFGLSCFRAGDYSIVRRPHGWGCARWVGSLSRIPEASALLWRCGFRRGGGVWR